MYSQGAPPGVGHDIIRHCPRCRTALSPLFNGRVELDHCPNCRGNFLERGETAQTFGHWAEPSHWVSEHIAEKRGVSPMFCPLGHGHLEVFDVGFDKRHVEIDVCPMCSGMWLDLHEGKMLSDLVRAYEQKKGAPPGVVSYIFQLVTGFPVEVWNPVKKTPWLMYILVAMNIAVFGAQFAMQSATPDLAKHFMMTFSVVPADVFAGKNMHSLITYAFLHGGFMHILGNLYFLFILGDNVEDRAGRFGFLLIYFGAAVLGAVAHMVSEPSSGVPMLGASGAISGIMGAYLVLFPRVRVWVVLFFVRFQISIYWYFLVWIGMQFVGILTGQFGVAWWAHVGGFVAGLSIGGVYRLMGKQKAEVVATHGVRPVNMPQGPRGF